MPWLGCPNAIDINSKTKERSIEKCGKCGSTKKCGIILHHFHTFPHAQNKDQKFILLIINDLHFYASFGTLVAFY